MCGSSTGSPSLDTCRRAQKRLEAKGSVSEKEDAPNKSELQN